MEDSIKNFPSKFFTLVLVALFVLSACAVYDNLSRGVTSLEVLESAPIEVVFEESPEDEVVLLGRLENICGIIDTWIALVGGKTISVANGDTYSISEDGLTLYGPLVGVAKTYISDKYYSDNLGVYRLNGEILTVEIDLASVTSEGGSLTLFDYHNRSENYYYTFTFVD